MLQAIQEGREVVHSRREILIAHGIDPDAELAKLDAMEAETQQRRRAVLRAEEALLQALAHQADGATHGTLHYCRLYLSVRPDYYERLANLSPLDRPGYEEMFDTIEHLACDGFQALPAADRAALLREGWQESWRPRGDL